MHVGFEKGHKVSLCTRCRHRHLRAGPCFFSYLTAYQQRKVVDGVILILALGDPISDTKSDFMTTKSIQQREREPKLNS